MIDNNLIQKTKGLNLIYTRASTLFVIKNLFILIQESKS